MKILMRTNESENWQLAESVKAKGEAELQDLLIESPSLIPVDEIREGVTPLVLAVGEFGLPGSGATDILAFSADGDIAVVECKLAANPESKRKVVGQILEYAAYLWEMDYEEINERIRRSRGKNLSELVEEATSGEWDEEAFRRGIEQSSKGGGFILIIVVDEINEELRHVIRYVNECSQSAFSLHALELSRFRAAGVDVLVPYLHGVSTKPSGREASGIRWSEERFFEALAKSVEARVADVVRDLYTWSQDAADSISFGKGAITGSFTFCFLREGQRLSVFTIYTSSALVLNYGSLTEKVSLATMREFHKKIQDIPTFRAMPAEFDKWPSIRAGDAFQDPRSVSQFKQAVMWLEDQLVPSAS